VRCGPTPWAVETTAIEGLWSVRFREADDRRGVVRELYRESDFAASGLPSLGDRPQTNCTETRRGGLRGIHGELAHKLVGLVAGAGYAVAVDLRPSSPTAGRWLGFDLRPGQGLFLSAGLGNAYQSVSDEPSQYVYCFAVEWRPDMPGVHVSPLDPALAIDWPIGGDEGMILSDKDADPSRTLSRALGRG
jgi:dTDP-4-dehydrorhamnose 3,5-epimerase